MTGAERVMLASEFEGRPRKTTNMKFLLAASIKQTESLSDPELHRGQPEIFTSGLRVQQLSRIP